MKKLLMAIIAGTLLLSLVGCGGNKTVDNNSENNVNAQVEGENEEKEQPPVTIEEVPMNLTILEPDSIGNRYMEATFTNNSKYAIKGFNVTVLLKDKNEKTYLGNYDTIMPGETSPKFESFAPETGNVEDIEYLQYDITVVDENGQEIYLTYDVKLKMYEWF
jgi:ABC-type Fe3+-hydroxamate transport system substrate-binding protein